ncbi:MAG: MmgE/PrpD family protein, partial [Candidatus Hodarchaeales archaeon]
ILNLNIEETIDALAMATNFASGLMQCWLSGTSEWLFTSGLAAQNGVLSALIGKNGGKGSHESFEGDRGYFKAYLGVQPDGIDVFRKNLGKDFLTPKVLLKPFSVITTILPVINNVVKIVTQNDLFPDDIREVKVVVGPRVTAGPLKSSIIDKGPFVNKTQAYKSIYCSIGIALMHRDVNPQTVKLFKEPTVSVLGDKVVVVSDEKAKGFFNRIEITTLDGKKFETQGEEFPTLTSEQVKHNFTRAASEYIPTSKVEKLILGIKNLEKSPIEEVSYNLSK